LGWGVTLPSSGQRAEGSAHENIPSSQIETFTFPSNGKTVQGKIFLPASHKDHKNLPAIFLVDFTEQHFKIATDEFEKAIEGVQRVEGLDVLVVSLEGIPDIDAQPESFHEQYGMFKDMAAYVDGE
jgi:hypothetical protein